MNRNFINTMALNCLNSSNFINDEGELDFATDNTYSIHDEYTNCKTYKYKGVSYLIPNSPEKDNEFEDFKIESLNGSINLDKQSVYTDPHFEGESIMVTLTPVSLYEENHARLLLYREGTSKPVFFEERTYSGAMFFKIDNKHITPGHYFFIIPKFDHDVIHMNVIERQDELAIYHFDVYHSGSKIEIPEIKSVECKSVPKPFTADSLNLTIRLKKSTPDNKHMCAVCFDKDMNIVDQSHAVVKNHRRFFNLDFTPSIVWTHDTHTILIAVNDMPQYKIIISSFDDENIDSHWEAISPNSYEFPLCRMHINTPFKWKELLKIGGSQQLQRATLNYYHIAEYNRNMQTQIERTHSFCHNFTIATDNGTLSSMEVESFIHCLTGEDFSSSNYHAGKLRMPSDGNKNVYNNDDAYEVNLSEQKCLIITELDGLCGPYSSKFVDNLISSMSYRSNYSVVMLGKKREIEDVFKAHPRLKCFFPDKHHLEMRSLSPLEITRKVCDRLHNKSILFHSEDQQKLANHLLSLESKGILKKMNIDDVRFIVNTHFVNQYTSQMTKSASIRHHIAISDIDLNLFANPTEKNTNHLADLDKMVGLKNIKKSVTQLFALTRFNHMRRSLGLKANDNGCHHMIFTGNPGTGKTSVAKVIGKMFHSIGVLSKGDVIFAERTNMVGRYIGETEQNMRDLLEQAQGNVLFIDEAYTLFTKDDDNDFGKHAIESLLTVLSQPNPDMIVILAGYGKEMNKLIDCNPGLKGRFPHHFNFEDYSADELTIIAEHIIADEQYRLTPDAHNLLAKCIAESVNKKDKSFSNARWVTQFVQNGIIPSVANRLISANIPLNADNCQTITIQDIEAANLQYGIKATSTVKKRCKVGFNIS